MPDVVNFVTDFGAPTDGTSNCAAAILAANVFCRTHNDVKIITPAHNYIVGTTSFLGESSGNGSQIVWDGAGATFTASGGAGIWLSGGTVSAGPTNFQNSNLFSARIATVLRGSSSLTLLNGGDVSRFAVGLYIYIGAGDMQGVGLPPNHATLEFAKVIGISGLTLTLDRQLRNDYLATLPLYNAGDASHLDEGGPATIYAMQTGWDILLRFLGVSFNNGAGQLGAPCRRIELIDCNCLSTLGIIPSANQDFIINGGDYSACDVEVDKAVQNLEIGATSFHRIHFQSASGGMQFTADGLTVANRLLQLPRRSMLSNVTVASEDASSALRIGPSFGAAEEIFIYTSIVPSMDGNGVIDVDILNNGFSFSGNLVIRAKSLGALQWAAPGAYLIFSQQNKNNNWQSRIDNVTLNGSNVNVALADTIPSWVGNGFPVSVRLHPAPLAWFEGVTGCPVVEDLSQLLARGRPIYEYSKRVYSGGASAGIEALSAAVATRLWGHITQIDFRVTQAYTGVQATLLANIFNPLRQINPNGSLSTWDPVINLKTSGTRTFIPGTGWSGTKVGDTLTDPGNVWFAGDQQLTVNHDVSGEASDKWPILEIEVNLDQGIEPPAPPPTPTTPPPSGFPYLNPITVTTLRHRNYPVPAGYPHAKSSLVSPYGHRQNQRLGSTFRSGSPVAHRIGGGIKLPPRRRK